MSLAPEPAYSQAMPGADPPSREDRLAAKLRENLRRRKTQARGLAARDLPAAPDSSSAALFKPPAKS